MAVKKDEEKKEGTSSQTNQNQGSQSQVSESQGTNKAPNAGSTGDQSSPSGQAQKQGNQLNASVTKTKKQGKIEPAFKEYSRTNPAKLFADHMKSIGTGIKYLVKPQRITLFYPEEALSLPTGYRGMIRLYKDVCIGCTLCALICPADAMKMVTDEGKKVPTINYGRCVFCGFCVDVCPVDALKETRVHDVAFSNRRDLVFSPNKFNRNFDQPLSLEKPVKKMKTVIDEKKGIKYVPDE